MSEMLELRQRLEREANTLAEAIAEQDLILEEVRRRREDLVRHHIEVAGAVKRLNRPSVVEKTPENGIVRLGNASTVARS